MLDTLASEGKHEVKKDSVEGINLIAKIGKSLVFPLQARLKLMGGLRLTGSLDLGPSASKSGRRRASLSETDRSGGRGPGGSLHARR